MAEISILNGYKIKDKKAIRFYDTVDDMINDSTLKEGMHVKTKGYYNVNDGGGAEYHITATESNSEYQEEISNNLYATLIIDNDTVDFRQLGGILNDNTFDSKNVVLDYVNLCEKVNKTLKLLIPEGNIYLSPTHICRIGGVNIEGCSGFPARGYMGTVLNPLNDNQNYILKFGGESNMDSTTLSYDATNTSNIIKNITFSSNGKNINYGCLVLEYANYGIYEDIYFNSVIGTGLYIRSSWENYFNRINFRSISDFSKPKLLFDTARSITGVSGNISSSSFDKLMFENCCGNLIQVNVSANFLNNQFGEINIENSYNALLPNETATNITENTDLSTMTPLYVFYGVGFDNTFDTINYTGLNAREKYYTSRDNDNYYFQGIFGVPSSTEAIEGNIFNNIINNIFLRRDATILTTNELFYNAFKFSCSNIVGSTKISKKFEINNGCGQINILNFTDRDTATSSVNRHVKMLNSIDLYKYGINGTTYYNENAINDLGLILKKYTSSTVLLNGLFYPFDYSQTKKQLFKLRCKGSGSFVVRGLVDGSNSDKTYSLTNTGDWENISIEMNYDAFSPITIISSASTIEYDTLSYIGEEDIV